jgi:broad specificity phosphatase PhoE
MRILFIRHAQTVDNVNGAIGTVIPGPELTGLGARQAAAIPDALDSERIDAVYISTMLRTRLTADPLARARGLTPRMIDGIEEITAGSLEARTDPEAIRLYMGTIFSWWDDFDTRIPDGEDGHEFYGRFDRAVGVIAAGHPDDATVAVVSHGAAIRTWVSWSSENLDAEFSRVHHLDNTSIVVVEGSPSAGWQTTYWAGEPVGGAALGDPSAVDPTADIAP